MTQALQIEGRQSLREPIITTLTQVWTTISSRVAANCD